jgi:zinc transport system permease protein
MFSILGYSFIQNAILTIIMASVICGIVGTIIVEKKSVMLSGGIAHISFAGIGLGFFLGIEPIIPALICAVIATLLISWINKKTETNIDSVIGIFWSFGMAIGIFFAFYTKGYNPDMLSYLFGDILTISSFYIKLESVVVILNILVLLSLYEYIKLYLFDETYLKIRTKGINFIEAILNIVVAMSIVILIKVVGIILVIAMLTIPVSISKMYIYDFKKIIISSMFVSMILSFMGLYTSYLMDVPAGATIIIIMAMTYFALGIVKRRN